jgi:hypothetical protein
MPTDALTLTLARIVARDDGLWTPHRVTRGSSNSCAAAIAEQRARFRSHGLTLTMGGSALERKSGGRLLAELERKGLIRLEKHHGQHRGVALTDFGDDIARSFVPTNRVDQSFPALELIRATEKLFRGRTNAGFILEHDILEIESVDDGEPNLDPKPFLDFEDQCLPLLCRGLLESASDTEGRIGYRTTAAGREALLAGPPEAPTQLPDRNPELSQRFIDLYVAELAARESWIPDRHSSVWIPLSAGMWPERPRKRRAASA